jgi:hypothetical protein
LNTSTKRNDGANYYNSLSLRSSVDHRKTTGIKGCPDLLNEFLVDSDIVYIPVPSYKQTTVAGFDGTNYLIVWADERRVDNYDIYGAGLTPDGVLLDSSGIIISSAFSGRKWPTVDFDGTNYLVVWADWRNNEVADIYGTRITPSGIVLDPDGIPISTANDPQVRCSVAFDGTNYFVVWDDYRVGWPINDIYGARVTTDGVVLDPDGIPICTAPNNQSYPDLAFDGTNYLVVWDDLRSGAIYEIYGSRVTPSGNVLDPGGIPISANASANGGLDPHIDFDGTNYFVAWDDFNSNIVGTRITPGGTVLDNAISISTGGWQEIFPIIVFNGQNYLVAWDDYRNGTPYDIYGTRVSTDGTVLEPSGIPIFHQCGWQDPAGITSDNSNYLISMISSDYNLFAARVDSQGTLIDTSGILMSTASYPQYSPSVFYDNTNYLVVWDDYRNDNGDIYGTRVSPAGSILDSNAISISTDDSTQSFPSTSFDGTNYFIVWQDKRGSYDIYGARVNTSGILIDSSGFAISTANAHQEYPSVAFDGTNYLAVWQDKRNSSNADIYGARISTSGTVLDPSGLPISTAANKQSTPSIVSGDTNYFVVWQDYRNSSYEIYGARVDSSGNILDPSGIPIATSGPNWNPHVAFDGTNYFVVWGTGLSFDQDISGARVSQGGVVLDPGGITIAGVSGNQCLSCAAYDGMNYVVIWQDLRNGDNYDVYGARVSSSGIVLDPDGLELINQPYNRMNPVLVKGPANQLLLAFEGFATEPYNNLRIFGALCEDMTVKEQNITIPFQIEVYPNPFSNRINIGYTIQGSRYRIEEFSLKVYDVSGRLIKTFSLPTAYSPLPTVVSWDGTDQAGQKLPAGVYFCQFWCNNEKEIKKLIMVR